tara:strand:- start:63986 stop:64375 length:390 start_codon:yes stop_codon:yes gene_type:complete
MCRISKEFKLRKEIYKDLETISKKKEKIVLKNNNNEVNFKIKCSVLLCLHCKGLAISRYQYEFSYCPCNQCAIDSGDSQYSRILGSDYKYYTLCSIQNKDIRKQNKKYQDNVEILNQKINKYCEINNEK